MSARKNKGAESPRIVDVLEKIRGSGLLVWRLSWYGVETMADLADWSRAELLRLEGVGPVKVGLIEGALQSCGLSLHPDRPERKVRPTRQDREAAEADAQWQDREFLAEQCRRVLRVMYSANGVMENGRDDPAFTDALRALLRAVPRYANPLLHEAQRIRDACVKRIVDKHAPELAVLSRPGPVRQEGNVVYLGDR